MCSCFVDLFTCLKSYENRNDIKRYFHEPTQKKALASISLHAIQLVLYKQSPYSTITLSPQPLTFFGLQFRLGDKLLRIRMVCPPKRDCSTKGLNPFSTAVSFWGQTSQFPSSLSPKRDCGPKRVNAEKQEMCKEQARKYSYY